MQNYQEKRVVENESTEESSDIFTLVRNALSKKNRSYTIERSDVTIEQSFELRSIVIQSDTAMWMLAKLIESTVSTTMGFDEDGNIVIDTSHLPDQEGNSSFLQTEFSKDALHLTVSDTYTGSIPLSDLEAAMKKCAHHEGSQMIGINMTLENIGTSAGCLEQSYNITLNLTPAQRSKSIFHLPDAEMPTPSLLTSTE